MCAVSFVSQRFALYLSLCLVTTPSPQTSQDRLIFQTGHAWSPRTNINAGTVMVYGIDETHR